MRLSVCVSCQFATNIPHARRYLPRIRVFCVVHPPRRVELRRAHTEQWFINHATHIHTRSARVACTCAYRCMRVLTLVVYALSVWCSKQRFARKRAERRQRRRVADYLLYKFTVRCIHYYMHTCTTYKLHNTPRICIMYTVYTICWWVIGECVKPCWLTCTIGCTHVYNSCMCVTVAAWRCGFTYCKMIVFERRVPVSRIASRKWNEIVKLAHKYRVSSLLCSTIWLQMVRERAIAQNQHAKTTQHKDQYLCRRNVVNAPPSFEYRAPIDNARAQFQLRIRAWAHQCDLHVDHTCACVRILRVRWFQGHLAVAAVRACRDCECVGISYTKRLKHRVYINAVCRIITQSSEHSCTLLWY